MSPGPIAAAVSPAVTAVGTFAHRHQLTARERQVLDLLVAGVAPKEMAERLRVAPSTVRFHAARLYVKCNVTNQRELLALFARTSCSAPANGETGEPNILTGRRRRSVESS